MTVPIQHALIVNNIQIYQEPSSADVWLPQFRSSLRTFDWDSDGSYDGLDGTSPISMPQNTSMLYTTEEMLEVLREMLQHMIYSGDAFVRSDKVYIGATTGRFQVGDVICVLFGSSMAYILRPVDDHYKFVERMYMPGIRGGEVIRAMDRGEV